MFETKPLVHGLSWSADKRRMVLQILLAALLVFLISAVQAQTAPGDDNKTALGDAWLFREDLVHVPREALQLPDRSPPTDLEAATGDDWPSRWKRRGFDPAR